MSKVSNVIIGVGGLAFATLCAYLGFSKKETKKEPSKYSMEWIKNLSDMDWETEREIVRLKFCNPEYDVDTREQFHNLLRLFDKVKSDRDWAGVTPHGPSYHREHGCNLYKP
ncbi:MAG: hypothetical protein LUE14_13755 [Clostridiales bacterium]|nr:hypothetical protein [Clostridiales bacterium]